MAITIREAYAWEGSSCEGHRAEIDLETKVTKRPEGLRVVGIQPPGSLYATSVRLCPACLQELFDEIALTLTGRA